MNNPNGPIKLYSCAAANVARVHESLPSLAAIYDMRGFANPHNVKELHPLDGRNEQVQRWLNDHRSWREFLDATVHAAQLPKAYPHIIFFCHGGVHRSVAAAEMVAGRLRTLGWEVVVTHNELEVKA